MKIYTRICQTIAFAAIFIVCIATNSFAQRAIPDDNLAYPVLISLGNGTSGSGFYLNSSDAVYLVTAKHVLFEPDTQPGGGAGPPKLRSGEPNCFPIRGIHRRPRAICFQSI